MKYSCLSLLLLLCFLESQAQFAPQAGVPGSTAISKSNPVFVAWATQCHILRGYQQIDNHSYGLANLGDSSLGIGAADGSTVSLGDSGIAILQFDHPIINGPGADFAVFENGFANVNNPEEAFLELAFVEVSSDGLHYTRFPATSNTKDSIQLSSISAPSYTNARQLNNLAGKYIGGYGTPFDLHELVDSPGLNINHITHIRLVDAIGSIDSRGSKDAYGHAVNDPFPTPFPGSGFDLDAIGVIHQAFGTGIHAEKENALELYPNPAGAILNIRITEWQREAKISISDVLGRVLDQQAFNGTEIHYPLTSLIPGVYFIRVYSLNGYSCTHRFIHY